MSFADLYGPWGVPPPRDEATRVSVALLEMSSRLGGCQAT